MSATQMTPQHDAELDALIAAGWGDVEQRKIPKNWRTLRPPETDRRTGRAARLPFRRYSYCRVIPRPAGMTKKQRLDWHAAWMRVQYATPKNTVPRCPFCDGGMKKGVDFEWECAGKETS